MENVNQLTNQPVSDEALKGIAELAHAQLKKEIQIKSFEDQLERLNEDLSKLRDVLIPDAMTAVGMSSFKLDDGTEVRVDKFYSASISEDMKVPAFKWLRDNQFAEIIKHEFKMNFGKGEDETAKALKEELLKRKITFADKEFVHPMTLKAFVREQIEAGKPLPMMELGVYIGNRAKITPATKK